MQTPNFQASLAFCHRLTALVNGFREQGYQPKVEYPEDLSEPVLVIVDGHPLKHLGPMPDFTMCVMEYLIDRKQLERSITPFSVYSEEEWRQVERWVPRPS